MNVSTETGDRLESALNSTIHHEEVRMLYGSMVFSLLASIVVALIMYMVLLGHVRHPPYLHAWIVVMLMSAALRGFDTWLFQRSSHETQQHEKWSYRFLAGSTFAGFWWGMLAWLGYSTEQEYQMLIVVCIVGIAGGSLSSLSYRWQTIAFFLMPALFLLELRMLLDHSAFSNVVSALLAVFILFSLTASRRVYKNSNQNVRLRVEASHREQALMTAKDEAEQADKAKSVFLSNMSHDLRTPLNAILGFTQLLKLDDTLSVKQRSNIDEIDQAGRLLLELVNQVLDLARIEEGSIKLDMRHLSLPEVLNECHSLIKPMAHEKRIALLFPEDYECTVYADKTRLKQVLLNLLSNAVKYNHERGSVFLRCMQVDDRYISLEVEDNGYGIPGDRLESIFQPFTRAQNHGPEIEGTGIGLSIARQLTELMGGKMRVESEPGKGSSFFVELEGTHREIPKLPVTGAGSQDQHAVASSPAGQRGRILVVEDNATNQKLISSQLQILGYDTDLAANGREALALFTPSHHTLVLTDCNMPVMNGYELARALREQYGNELPIVALTADAFPDSETRCIEAGINDRIVKPADLNKLATTIRRWLAEEQQ